MVNICPVWWSMMTKSIFQKKCFSSKCLISTRQQQQGEKQKRKKFVCVKSVAMDLTKNISKLVEMNTIVHFSIFHSSFHFVYSRFSRSIPINRHSFFTILQWCVFQCEQSHWSNGNTTFYRWIHLTFHSQDVHFLDICSYLWKNIREIWMWWFLFYCSKNHSLHSNPHE